MRINKVYKDFIFQKGINISVLFGGSGSGKSHAVVQKLIYRALNGKEKILVLRRNQVTLKDSCIALFKQILEEEGIEYKYNASSFTMTIGESTILFKGIDTDTERIKSIVGITICWLEEASEFIPDAFYQLLLRLRDKDHSPEFILTFNPVSKSNWLWPTLFEDGPQNLLKNRTSYILKTTWRDNKANLPEAYISSLLDMQRTNPLYYAVYSEGEWGTLGKLIFPYGSYTIGKPSEDILASPNKKYLQGMDFGWNDPNALACSVLINDHILYTYKEWSQSEVTADLIASKLKEMCPSGIIYGDNAAAAQIAEVQKKGVYNLTPNHKPPGSVLADINSLKCYDWYIDPSCPELIRELGIYQWKKDKQTGYYLEEPERGSGATHVNVIDAVRYSLECLGSEVKTIKLKGYKGL